MKNKFITNTWKYRFYKLKHNYVVMIFSGMILLILLEGFLDLFTRFSIISSPYFIVSTLVMTSLLVWQAYEQKKGADKGLALFEERYKIDNFNRKNFVYYPKSTPASTVEKCLKRRRDIQSVKSFYSQSYSLSHTYFDEQLPQFLNLMPVTEKVEIMGRGTQEEADTLEQSLLSKLDHVKDVKVHAILNGDNLTEHFNVIVTDDDRAFVWFEPYHDDAHEFYWVEKGGFFFDVLDTQYAIDSFYKPIGLKQAA